MDIEREISKICRESEEYLESLSALELMENARLFARDLNKLVHSQRLPISILVGCLMCEVNAVATQPGDMLLDDRIAKSFKSFKRYVDTKFMEKE